MTTEVLPNPSPAPAPAPSPAPAPTIVRPNGGVPDPALAPAPAPAPTGDFAPEWRDKFAEQLKPGDTGFRKRLDRFTSPYDVGKSWLAIEQRLSSGELKAQLPKDAKDEDVAQWRKDNGLPEKADGYVAGLKLPDGVVVGEADKPLVADLAENVAHKGLWSQQHVNDVVGWYYRVQDAQALKRGEADGAFKSATEDALRTEMGADYRPNINAVQNLIARMPTDIAEPFLTARMPSPTKDEPGRTVPLGNHPAVIKWMAALELELNPAAKLLPSSGGDPAKGVLEEIETIRKFNRENPDAYEADKKMQARYLALIEIRDHNKAA